MRELHWSIASKILSDYSCGTTLMGVEALRCPLLKAVRAWCENNGISIDYEDTVKMRFQRMRSSYLKSGIDLRRTSREKDN